jgi:MFS family permease
VIAASAAIALIALAVAAGTGRAVTVPVLLIAMVLTVSWHGVGYAAVAENAPPSWAGRALGAQTTIQNAAGALAPPLFGALAGAKGYPAAYAAAAVAPVLAALCFPGTTRGRQPDRPPPPREDTQPKKTSASA